MEYRSRYDRQGSGRRHSLPRRHAQEMRPNPYRRPSSPQARSAALAPSNHYSGEYLSAYEDVLNMADDLERQAGRSVHNDTKKLLIDVANSILDAADYAGYKRY